jgi:hypothetical protein
MQDPEFRREYEPAREQIEQGDVPKKPLTGVIERPGVDQLVLGRRVV